MENPLESDGIHPLISYHICHLLAATTTPMPIVGYTEFTITLMVQKGGMRIDVHVHESQDAIILPHSES